MAYYGVTKLEDGSLLVMASTTPEDGDGVFADMQFVVSVGDADYDRYLALVVSA